MRDFDTNDIIEYAGDQYLVLMNYGDSGTVAAMGDDMQVVTGFRWSFEGEDCRFVKTASGATQGLLPGGQWKYVRFADGFVDFCTAFNPGDSHRQLVMDRQDVPPVSAGKIKVREGRWIICEGGSYTAKLNRGESDEKYIAKALPHLRYDNDMIYEY